MRPVAEWFRGAGLAAAPGNLFFFCDLHEHRPHAGGAVGAVAKRLLLGQAAATPDITPGFDVYYKGMVIFAHQLILTAGWRHGNGLA